MDLHDAIRLAYKGRITQTALAEQLGVQQNTISRWVTGETTPSLDQIKALEVAAGRPVGFVLRQAGFVESSRTLENAVDSDPTLDEADRRLVRDAVDFARFRAAQRLGT